MVLFLCALVASVSAQEPPAPAEAYGTGVQDLWVPALRFAPQFPAVGLWEYQAFMFYANAGADFTSFMAPVELPAGALITALECTFDDPSSTGNASVQLGESVYNVSTDVREANSIASVQTTGSGGFQNPSVALNKIVRYRIGTDRLFLYLQALMPADKTVRLRGCRLSWNRRVSPAPAIATFGDVPDADPGPAHPQFQYIEALVAAGITAGCSTTVPPNYCPDSPVTRGQMAVFLARLAGLHFAH